MNRPSLIHCETLPSIRLPKTNVFVRSPINGDQALAPTLRPIDRSRQRMAVPTGPQRVRTPIRSQAVPHHPPLLPSKPPVPRIPSSVRPFPDQHSIPPPRRQADTAPAGSIAQILDTVFRPCTERLQAELSNLRSACARAILRENREKERWKSHCVTFKQERDEAREQLRSLTKEKQARQISTSEPLTVLRGTKRRWVDDDELFETDVRVLDSRNASPSSSTSSITLIASPSDSLYDPSPASPSKNPPLPLCHSPEADLAIPGSPPPHMPVELRAKRPRRNVPELDGCRSRAPTPEGHLGEVDMDLDSEAEAAAPAGPDAVPDSALPSLNISHVDLMYSFVENRWVCRPCVFHSKKMPADRRPTPESFPANASWSALVQHATRKHPQESADVSRLRPEDLFELRRRLMLSK